MFYRKKSNQYINEDSSFIIEGISYPASWLRNASIIDKQKLELEEVITTNTPSNPEFYWITETLKENIKSYISTPKDINMLKEMLTNKVKNLAFSILSPTDYIEVLNIRDSTYKPEWILWRNSIREYVKNTCLSISNSNTVEELEKINSEIVWANNPDYTI